MTQKLLLFAKVIIPMALALAVLTIGPVSSANAAPPAEAGYYYTVKYGDTMYHIGRVTGVNPYHIAEANGIHNLNHIYAGEVLYIPSASGYHRKPAHYDKGYNHKPTSYNHSTYGYDYTGYYYESDYSQPGYSYYYPSHKRYSYTCGYYYNCY